MKLYHGRLAGRPEPSDLSTSRKSSHFPFLHCNTHQGIVCGSKWGNAFWKLKAENHWVYLKIWNNFERCIRTYIYVTFQNCSRILNVTTRATELEPFFRFEAAGSSNFAGAGANLITASDSGASEFKPGSDSEVKALCFLFKKLVFFFQEKHVFSYKRRFYFSKFFAQKSGLLVFFFSKNVSFSGKTLFFFRKNMIFSEKTCFFRNFVRRAGVTVQSSEPEPGAKPFWWSQILLDSRALVTTIFQSYPIFTRNLMGHLKILAFPWYVPKSDGSSFPLRRPWLYIKEKKFYGEEICLFYIMASIIKVKTQIKHSVNVWLTN